MTLKEWRHVHRWLSECNITTIGRLHTVVVLYELDTDGKLINQAAIWHRYGCTYKEIVGGKI